MISEVDVTSLQLGDSMPPDLESPMAQDLAAQDSKQVKTVKTRDLYSTESLKLFENA